MEQFKNHKIDFHEIQYCGVILKFVNTFQFWLKSVNNNNHFGNSGVECQGSATKELIKKLVNECHLLLHSGKWSSRIQ
jgi:hypothetical protein